MKTRLRYTKVDNRLESKPVVIGVNAYRAVINDSLDVWILNNDTMQVMSKSRPMKNLNAAKKEAKLRLLMLGAVFSEEARNRKSKTSKVNF